MFGSASKSRTPKKKHRTTSQTGNEVNRFLHHVDRIKARRALTDRSAVIMRKQIIENPNYLMIAENDYYSHEYVD